MIKLTASSAPRWVNCPASARHPSTTTSDSARDGIQAHAAAAQYFNTRSMPDNLGPEMTSAVSYYVSEVEKEPFDRVGTEHSIRLSLTDSVCTIDRFHFQGNKCTIWDFKYGFTPVSAYRNWQLVCYALAVAQEHPHITEYNLRIVQPRAVNGHKVDDWYVASTDLLDYSLELSQAVEAARQERPPAKSGPHCKYCGALYNCHTLAVATALAMDYTSADFTYSMEPVEVARSLAALEVAERNIKNRKQALEQHAEGIIRAGKAVPGYTLKPGRGKTAWTTDPDAITTAGQLCGVDVRKPQQLITPKQAIDAGMPADLVGQLSETTAGAMSLKQINTEEIFR